MAPIPVPLNSAKMELLDGFPTMVGGFNGTGQSSLLYQYNIDTDQWRIHPTLRMRLARSSAAVFQVPKSMFDDC